MRGPILHPGMLDRLKPRFFTSLCQITAADPAATPTGFGEPGGTLVVVAGCDSIPCSLQRAGTLRAAETALPGATVARQQWALMLAGEYRQIEERMTAAVDGMAYNITSVAHVSVGGFTVLTVEKVVP